MTSWIIVNQKESDERRRGIAREYYGNLDTWLIHLSCNDNPHDTICVIMYEGWNFNSGNYLFTTDTK